MNQGIVYSIASVDLGAKPVLSRPSEISRWSRLGLPACGPNNGQGGGQKAGQSTVQPVSPRQKPAQWQQADAVGKKHRLSPEELKRHR